MSTVRVVGCIASSFYARIQSWCMVHRMNAADDEHAEHVEAMLHYVISRHAASYSQQVTLWLDFDLHKLRQCLPSLSLLLLWLECPTLLSMVMLTMVIADGLASGCWF
jgi:hypothetical protein